LELDEYISDLWESLKRRMSSTTSQSFPDPDTFAKKGWGILEQVLPIPILGLLYSQLGLALRKKEGWLSLSGGGGNVYTTKK
jgi:hypothetical protein